MNPLRRKILATGAAATAMAAVRRVFGQQTGKGAGAMSFYEKGPVRIHYEETGSGYPLLLIAGGGLNSTIAGLMNPLTRSGSSRASTVASRRTCATPIPVNPLVRWRSTGLGIHTRLTSSV